MNVADSPFKNQTTLVEEIDTKRGNRNAANEKMSKLASLRKEIVSYRQHVTARLGNAAK